MAGRPPAGLLRRVNDDIGTSTSGIPPRGRERDVPGGCPRPPGWRLAARHWRWCCQDARQGRRIDRARVAPRVPRKSSHRDRRRARLVTPSGSREPLEREYRCPPGRAYCPLGRKLRVTITLVGLLAAAACSSDSSVDLVVVELVAPPSSHRRSPGCSTVGTGMRRPPAVLNRRRLLEPDRRLRVLTWRKR